ncbi:MAG: diaminopimelate epimerase [Spirochaetia bacterium]
MEIDFLKMQGCGDDLVVVNGPRVPAATPEHLPYLAQRILDRGFGVGGNSLVVLGASADGVLAVRCLDPEGDELGISCNASRCAARYASDSGAVSTNDFLVECGAQKHRVQIIDSANVRVDMGTPFSGEKSAEIRESLRESFTRSILVEGRSVTYTPISLGRSYAMIFVPSFSFHVRRTAREIAAQPDFPEGTGIGFVQVYSREDLRLRTWEAPGEGRADQCACASAALVAAAVNGLTDREVFVHLPGGNVFLQWEEPDNHIWLTGPTAYVFTGTYDFTPVSGD